MSALPSLYLISDAEGFGEEHFLAQSRRAILGGLRWLQVREPDWPDERIKRLVERLRDIIAELQIAEVKLSLGRRPGLAVALGLDGAHVGGGNPENVRQARQILGPDRPVGYSAHRLAELPLVAAAGASYVSYSPIFGALSKPHALEPVGLEGLRSACAMARVPVYALGAVTPAVAGELRAAGAAGAAMIGSILGAASPEWVVREFFRRWNDSTGTRRPASIPAACEPER